MTTCVSHDPAILNLPLYDNGHRALAERLEDWCGSRMSDWERDSDRDPAERCRALMAELGDAGWLAHLDGGGEASDMRSVCVRRQTLAYHEDLSDLTYSIQELAAIAVARYGTAEQRGRYLPGMSDGSVVAAVALSEEGAGSDLGAVALRAEPSHDGYVLNGVKTWIALGDIADMCVVLARTGDGPGPLGLSAFLVDMHATGVTRGAIEAIAPRSWAELTFTDCHVGTGALLGERGQGFVVALEMLERFRMTVAAAAVGFGRRAYRLALDRARGREAFGGRLADLQLVKSSLTSMDVRLSAAALLTARAALALDTGGEYAKDSAVAKLYATESAGQVVDAAVQVFGAAGVVSGTAIERLYRQVRALRIYEGSSELLAMTIAESL
ncbi:acyl-CoA dehydrogenase family protein [Haloechinothrix halophila]|uniref:acyl-CoA dehydrogenase family protein n=1 Tax=Haloechinothrix halophila TaxID=1069073 RepID=UPI00055651BE|nr:acyl-CoA dehydrogenase family protein [Haloechinothrix halophila]